MTDFGRRAGDMLKSTYDTDEDGIVDEAEGLSAGAQADANKIQGTEVDASAIADGKRLTYKSASSKLVYETPTAGGETFTNRGDPAAYDWQKANFTTDGTWRELDCSSIVPSGATAIAFTLIIEDDAAGTFFLLRKNGHSNSYNTTGLYTQVAAVAISGLFIIHCDTDRKVQYAGTNTAFTGIFLTVTGWFI